MSSPRYDWWGYAIRMARKYPYLKQKERELHNVSLNAPLNGMPHSPGISDPTASAALRTLSPAEQAEMDSVDRALEQIAKLDTGEERKKLVEMYHFRHLYTLDGAALQLNISIITAKRWNRDFLSLVGENRGLNQKMIRESQKNVV